MLALVLAGATAAHSRRATSACPLGATLNVVAHEDDDLLFLSPDLVHDVQAGRCVRTIFVTAGDGGGGQGRWESREKGVEAAYAQMAQADGIWTASSVGPPGHPLGLLTLGGHPGVSVVFMHLPDGWMDGGGISVNGNESLQKLWQGSLESLHPVDGSPAFSRSELIAELAGLMAEFQPDTIRTQDYAGAFGDGDHSDHHATALFTREAERSYSLPHTVVGYQDYGTSDLPQNVFGADLDAKRGAFLAYLAYDTAPCGAPPDCGDNRYARWVAREYRLSASAGRGGGAADLRISGSLDHARAPVGDGLVWRLRVDDVNGAPAVGAYVDVDLPAGVDVAVATTDRGPGCVQTSAARLRCSLDYLSAESPVGNVLLITKVTAAGQLVVTATAGANGPDLAPVDNSIALRANAPEGQTGPLLPPRTASTPSLIRLVPSSVACSVGADGIVTATATVILDRPATIFVKGRRRSGRVVPLLEGSRVGGHAMGSPAMRLKASIAEPGSVGLALRVGTRRPGGPRPCAMIVTVLAVAPGPEVDRIRFRAG